MPGRSAPVCYLTILQNSQNSVAIESAATLCGLCSTWPGEKRLVKYVDFFPKFASDLIALSRLRLAKKIEKIADTLLRFSINLRTCTGSIHMLATHPKQVVVG